jgi:uncharacterized membrane protein YagU involved in acid resistance
LSREKIAGPGKAVVAGTLAGAAGSAMMDVYWWVMQGVPGARPEQKPRPGDHSPKHEPATQLMADTLWQAVTGSDIPRDKKAVAGVGMHYAFGSVCGALWGLYASMRGRSTMVEGVLYGVVVWLLGDEGLMRIAKVSPEAEKVPLSQHIQALGAHLIYGAGVAVVTGRLARR